MPQLYIAKSGAKHAPALPLDAVTRTFGIYGQRGTGKTNTAVVLVEEMVRKGAHVCVLDPKGDWWGITRAGAGGAGLPGIVLGGDEGDVPLEETSGHLVAELVVDRHWPVVVVDLGRLRKGARRRFMADFLEELYERNREALHLVFEEAHQPLPQTPRGMDPVLGRVLGAAEDIVTLGRKRGIGVSLVSQRFATVNATVREQVETLLLHRLTGPLDRKAAKGWIEANGDAAVTQRVLDELPGFQLGDCLMYSPGWLGVLERVRIKARRTFDSSATPEVGAQAAELTERAPVDLGELRRLMAETVERAKENDPKELRKRIAELEGEVERVREEAPAAEPERVLVPDREAMSELSQVIATLHGALDEMTEDERLWREREAAFLAAVGEKRKAWEAVLGRAEALLTTAAALPQEGEILGSRTSIHDSRIMKRESRSEAPAPQAGTNGDGGPSRGALELARVLTGLYPLWVTRSQLAIFAKRGAKSSTLTQDIAALRDAGLIEDDRGRYRASGPEVVGRRAPNLRDLRRQLDDVLPDGPRALYRVLLKREELTRHDLFEAAGFSPTSSTPVGHLKLLIDNGIAARIRGGVALGPLVR